MDITNWYDLKENRETLVVAKNIENLEQYNNKKYDYIYLDGTLENAEKIMKTPNPYTDLINYFHNLLKEDGSLFVAVNNKFGVKYLVGDKSEHCENIYDSIKNKFSEGRLFSKNELVNIIKETNFANNRFYYPLPNYELPSVIFTDEYLPYKTNSKLNYNVIYDEDSLIVQDEIELLKLFISEGKFEEFTNSYIIELSNTEIKKENKYYSFNNMRKEKYSLILKMKEEYIEKYPKSQKAIQHIENINKYAKILKQLGFNVAEEENASKIVKSRFIKTEMLDKQIVELIDNKEIEKVYEYIENWYKYISEKLKVNEKGIVKEGFIDLVFENIFYDKEKNEYIIFDQEWLKNNISIKFILYRAIENLYKHNPHIELILPKQDIFEKYQIYDKIQEFELMEEKIQKEVIDEEKQNFYGEQYKYIIRPEEIQKIIKDIKRLDKDNIELLGEIKRLEEKTKSQDAILIEQDKEIKRLQKTGIQKIKEKVIKIKK